MPAIRLFDSVYLVGSGGVGLSAVTDCHIYLVGSADEFALIDAGGGLGAEEVVANISECVPSLQHVRYVLVTHSHWDHTGGAAALAEATGAKVAAASPAVETLESGRWPGSAARANVSMRGTHVERVVTDGDTLDVGALKIQVVGTPGHSADSVSYLAEINGKVLAFTGDSVDGQGVLGAIIVGPTLLQYEGSLRRLAECSPDGIMPGHGIPTLRNAREIITRAADKVATPWQGIDTSTRDYAPSWWLAHHPQTRQSPGLA